MAEEKTLAEKIDEIREAVQTTERKKKFRLPLGIRMQKGKPKRKNFVVVQTIKTNGSVSFKMMKIEDDTVKIGDNFYDASSQHILRYKRYPLIIVPEWSMKPFSPKESFEEAAKEGTLTAAEKLILTKMKLEAVKPKMQLNWKIILIILGVGAAVLYLLDYMKVI